jgi:Fe-S cluster assembly scaffold protein SufB
MRISRRAVECGWAQLLWVLASVLPCFAFQPISSLRKWSAVSPFENILVQQNLLATALSLRMVSIGLGPESEKVEDSTMLVAGIDYIVPDHEQHRLDRRSKIDVQADDWFTKLLTDPSAAGVCAGPVAEQAASQLLTVPELVNDIEKPTDDMEWTPYVTTKLPWSVLYPAYGLETYGLPIPRRNAEAWRCFDVPGMISDTIDGNLQSGLHNDRFSADNVRTELQRVGGWLNDDQCSARLIYLNNVFYPEMSVQTESVKNLASIEGLGEEALSLLQRLTACPVPMQNNADPLTSFSKLSTPNHNIGAPSSQFAINTQQGTACFAALNTIKCPNIAYVHDRAEETTKDDPKLPILIVQAVTGDGGISVADRNNENGVALHPRTLVIAESNTDITLVQQSVMLFDNDDDTSAARPLLKNGYTQILIKDHANVTHVMVDESGGVAVSGIEDAEDAIRATETIRPALQNTVIDTLDVHCAGTEASYTGTVLCTSGNGRTKTASTVSLLKPSSKCTLRGLTLTNGLCRTDVRTCIHHIADGCSSDQLQKQMVGGRGTAAFRGRIRVEQSAQQTDSHQLSRTVLLTDKCRAFSVPSLEIIADDVKCTHGATVSDLSDEEVFYLRSRGLDISAARNLLMFAFCNDMVDGIPSSVWLGANGKGGLQQRILQRLQTMTPRGARAVKGEFQSV